MTRAGVAKKAMTYQNRTIIGGQPMSDRAADPYGSRVELGSTGSVGAVDNPSVETIGSPRAGKTIQTNFQASEETLRFLRELRDGFGLTTNSAVIRRALALARVIVRAAQGADTIVVRKHDGGEMEIVLRG
jgi:hypothetical protein